MPVLNDAIAYYAGDTPAVALAVGDTLAWPTDYVSVARWADPLALQVGDREVISDTQFVHANAQVKTGPGSLVDAFGYTPGYGGSVQNIDWPEITFPAEGWSMCGWVENEPGIPAESTVSRPSFAPMATFANGASLQSNHTGGVCGIRGRFTAQYGAVITDPGWLFFYLWSTPIDGQAGWEFWSGDSLLIEQGRVVDPASIAQGGTFAPRQQLPSTVAGVAIYPRMLHGDEITGLRKARLS